MNSSDTPRTDGWIAENDDDGLVYVDFARQLERELTAANERIAALSDALRELVDSMDATCIDTSAEALERMYQAHESARAALSNPKQKEPTRGSPS